MAQYASNWRGKNRGKKGKKEMMKAKSRMKPFNNGKK